MPEEEIKNDLENKFDYLKGVITIKRERRIFVEVPSEHLVEVFEFTVRQLGFSFLSAITGMDEGNLFGIIYHLNKEGRIILNLKTHVSREKPAVGTVTNFFHYADIYEREIKDLFGIEVNGLTQGRRYPLPDNWPQDEFPLRKDWKSSVKEKKQEA